jgi:tryptophanyl-tRNA synthetase
LWNEFFGDPFSGTPYQKDLMNDIGKVGKMRDMASGAPYQKGAVKDIGGAGKMRDMAFPGTPYQKGSIDPEGQAAIESRFRQAAAQMGLRNFMERIARFKREIKDIPDYFHIREVLREPEAMLTHTPRIPGLDGRKMSKSYGNAIMLSESDDDIRKKTKVMVTDPARKRRSDPGNPDVCPVFDWHKLFSPPETQAWSAHGCRTAGIGCIECKAAMADNLIKWIEPVRQRRIDFERDPQQVLDYLDTGSKRARLVAQQTMDRVREAVFHWNEKRAEFGSAREIKKIEARG